jgi:peptide deformylase
VIIVASRSNPRYPDAPEMDAVVMVNPEILEFSQATCLGEEGCLSVPDERGQVERAQAIKLRYYTLQGEVIETILKVFLHVLCSMSGSFKWDTVCRTSELSLLLRDKKITKAII